MGKPRKVTKPHISFLKPDECQQLVDKLEKQQFLNYCNLLIITKKDYNILKERYKEIDGRIALPTKYYQSDSLSIVSGYFFVTPRKKNGK